MSETNPTATVVDEKLYGAWQKERAHVHLRGLLRGGVCLALGLPLYVLADWLLNLPWPGRLVALAAVLVTAVLLARRPLVAAGPALRPRARGVAGGKLHPGW